MANQKKLKNSKRRRNKKSQKAIEDATHIYHSGARCATETVGFSTPDNRSPTELRVDSTNGFIPLWDRGVTLNWRFQPLSILRMDDPETETEEIREIFGGALTAWGPAVPIRFQEVTQPWDFEIVLSPFDDCLGNACTIASAFFPDGGQHPLVLYPRLFDLDRENQIEIMAHELGHVFGLRHFFAEIDESDFPSELFGVDNKFTIMNYGEESQLTQTDINDLVRLYSGVWGGSLTQINGTPIQMVRPFSDLQLPAPSPALVASNLSRDQEHSCCRCRHHSSNYRA